MLVIKVHISVVNRASDFSPFLGSLHKKVSKTVERKSINPCPAAVCVYVCSTALPKVFNRARMCAFVHANIIGSWSSFVNHVRFCVGVSMITRSRSFCVQNKRVPFIDPICGSWYVCVCVLNESSMCLHPAPREMLSYGNPHICPPNSITAFCDSVCDFSIYIADFCQNSTINNKK